MTPELAWQIFSHFAALSLLAVGGAISTAPEMHRHLVVENHWLSDSQFNAAIAIAQGAPGPNVMFVSLLGWQVGDHLANAAGPWWAGLAGMMLAMAGIMLPSSALAFFVTRWLHQHPHALAVRALKTGLAPLAIALLLATAWLLSSANISHSPDSSHHWRIALFTLVSAFIVFQTRIHLLWLLATGALLGGLGVL